MSKKHYQMYINRLREQVRALLGGRCSRCGNDDHRVLQIDHINGDGGEERRITRNIRERLLSVLEKKGKGYQLLCANCHSIVEWERRNFGK